MTATDTPTITKTERRQRERYIRGGQWDDAILVFADGSRRYALRCTVDGDNVLVTTGSERHLRHSPADAVTVAFDIASVVRVIR